MDMEWQGYRLRPGVFKAGSRGTNDPNAKWWCRGVDAAGKVRSLGKVTNYRGVKGCAVTCDGRLFGISGREGDVGHLFCYDPDEHELRDLGLIASVLAERVYGFQFSCSVVGRDGQVFFGEHDRGGHIWLYLPSVRPQPARED